MEVIIPNALWVERGWASAEAEACMGMLLAETKKGLAVQLRYGKGKPYRDGGHRMGRYGDAEVKYSYKGVEKPVTPWTPSLLMLKRNVETRLSWSPNCGVVNLYSPTGDLYPHRDSHYIPQLGQRPTIVSVSYGATRTMVFHPLDVKGKRRKDGLVEVKVNAGDLMVMHDECDERWHHSLPEEPEASGMRLSVTFRRHLTS